MDNGVLSRLLKPGLTFRDSHHVLTPDIFTHSTGAFSSFILLNLAQLLYVLVIFCIRAYLPQSVLERQTHTFTKATLTLKNIIFNSECYQHAVVRIRFSC